MQRMVALNQMKLQMITSLARLYTLCFLWGAATHLCAQPSALTSQQGLSHTIYSYQTHQFNVQFHTQGWSMTWRTQAQRQSVPLASALKYTFLESNPFATTQNLCGRSILYQSLYPDVDLEVHLTERLKYDLILHPGGTLDAVTLQIQGGKMLRVEKNRVVLQTSYGLIEEHIPLSYQVIEGDTIYREVRYIRKGEQTLGFQAEFYDPNYALIVDPELIAASLTGSSVHQFSNTISYDTEENIYTGGEIFGTSTGRYTPTQGAFQDSFGGGHTDISITKFNPTGTDILYFIYLGGSDFDQPSSLVVDEVSKDLIVFGNTRSSNFPTTASVHDQTYNGETDIILSRLNVSGTELRASTYIGGGKRDGVVIRLTLNYKDESRGDTMLDREGGILFATSTESNNFPVTSGSSHHGKYDGVIGKVRPDLSSIEWAYYIGGSEEDRLFSMDTTASGYYVTGGTTSTDLPITTLPSSYQGRKINPSLSISTMSQDFIDGFIVHVRRDNQNIDHGTYVGTNRTDQTYFVEVDSKGDVYVLGQTWHDNYPVQAPTGGTIYSNPGGKIFLQKFNATLTESIWSTTIGSGSARPDISPTAFLVSNCDEIFLSGWGGEYFNGTGSSTEGLEVTSDAFQRDTDGSDFYLMVLSQNAATLGYASFFGSQEVSEHAHAASRFSKNGIIYQSVCFCFPRTIPFPSTPNAWARLSGAPTRCNKGFFKFALPSKAIQFSTNNQEDTDPGISSGCVPLTIVFKNESRVDITQSEWDFGDGTFRKNSDRNITYTFTETGTFKVRLRILGSECSFSQQVEKSIQVYNDTVSVSEDLLICEEEDAQLYADGGVAYAWTPASSLNDETAAHPTIDNLETSTEYTVEITTPNGCKKKETVLVSVQPKMSVELDIQPTDGGCDGNKSFQINSFISPTPEHLLWKMGDGNSFENVSEVNYTYKSTGVYTLEIEASTQVCHTHLTEELSASALFVPNVITPNEDRKNDYLEIESITEIRLKVFDRNGTMVYSDNNYQNNWNGSDLPAGVYYYAIETDTQDLCKGWLHLIK